MFVTQEDQRLYLTPWNYNSARVLGYLVKIVEDNGGEVEPYKHCMANNRVCEPTAEPKRIFGQSWIHFILDDMYYAISLDDNPFFDQNYLKTPVKNGKRLRNVYMETLSRDWMYDCLFRVTNDEEAKEIAYELFNIVLKAPNSGRYNMEPQKIQVPNTYDGGWHWEHKPVPDKWIEAKWKTY